MNKKMISVFTLAFFTLFISSCTTKKWKKIETMNTLKKRDRIVKLVKVSGEEIEFSIKGRGKLVNGIIKGVTYDSTTGKDRFVTIPLSEVELILLTRFSIIKVLGLIAISYVGVIFLCLLSE